MMDEKTKKKLIDKIKKDDGDADFVDAVIAVLSKENAGAEKSKKNYFRIETLIIVVSMLSSITAGIAAIDVSGWNSIWQYISPLIDIAVIALPAVVTMLVAYRRVKKSYETWIRHRKSTMAVNLLINNYLYGNEEFDRLAGTAAYKKFKYDMQEIWQDSADGFLNNMDK